MYLSFLVTITLSLASSVVFSVAYATEPVTNSVPTIKTIKSKFKNWKLMDQKKSSVKNILE